MEQIAEDRKEWVHRSVMSLKNLHSKSVQIQNLCKDYYVSGVSTENIRFDASTGNLKFLHDLITSDRDILQMPMSIHAFSQLCSKLGVPVRYISRCLKEGQIQLAGDNINSWLNDGDKNFLLRTYKDKIRGVLSDKYSMLDAPDILGVLASEVDPDEYSIKGHFLTEERLHARIVDRNSMNVKKDDLFAGIQVDSSDVGRSTLTVSFFIYKQVCSNGLVIAKKGGTLFKQVHRGLSSSEFRDNFVSAMNTLPNLIEEYSEVVSKAKEHNLSSKITSEDVRGILTPIKVSKETAEKIYSRIDVYGHNQFGLINAITEVAQDFTLDTRLLMEQFAGELLNRVA